MESNAPAATSGAVSPGARNQPTLHRQEETHEHEPDRSEGQVSPLPQQPPVGELVAEGEAPVLREAEDVEFLVIHEVGAAVLAEVRLDPVQVLEAGVHRGLAVVGGFVVASVHDSSRGNWSAFFRVLALVLCVLEGPKILQVRRVHTPATKQPYTHERS